MDMWVKLQFLIPGVQHAEEADLRAEMLGIATPRRLYGQQAVACGPPEGVSFELVNSTTCVGRKTNPFEPPLFSALPSIKLGFANQWNPPDMVSRRVRGRYGSRCFFWVKQDASELPDSHLFPTEKRLGNKPGSSSAPSCQSNCYPSPPSSPGSRAQRCHASSSAWTVQNHFPQMPQWQVAEVSQGSPVADSA